MLKGFFYSIVTLAIFVIRKVVTEKYGQTQIIPRVMLQLQL